MTNESQAPQGASFEAVVRVLVRRRRLFLPPLLIVPPLAIAAALVLPPTYQVTAKFAVEDPAKVNPFLDDFAVPWDLKNRIGLIEAIVKGHDSLERIARAESPDFEYLGPAAKESRLDGVARRVQVMSLGPGLVAMSFNAGSSKSAKAGIDAMVATFTQETLRPQKEAMANASAFLDGQLARVRTELDRARDDLRAFKEAHVDELPEAWRVNLDHMLALRRAVDDSASEEEARERKQQLLGERLSLLDPVGRQLEASIAKAEQRLTELRSRLRDDHPDVRRARAELAGLRTSLAARTTRGLTPDQMERSLEVPSGRPGSGEAPGDERALWISDLLSYREARVERESEASRRESLAKRLAETTERVKNFPAQEQRLDELTQDLEIKSKVYSRLLEKYEDSLVTRALALSEEQTQVRLLEPPRTPESPSKPNRLVIAIAGPFVALLLGLLLAALAEALDTSIRTEADVFRITGRRPVSRLPVLEA